MRCVTSSQTAERLLLVLGLIGLPKRLNMAEGGWGLMSRPHDDVSNFSDLPSADLLFDDDADPDFHLTSSPSQSRRASVSRDGDSACDDSESECFPLEMERALRAAVRSGTLTPLLKEELRCKIQLRRLQHGKDEMTPDFSVKQSAMSVEEVVKRNRKMQQNRMSAQRSRDKQKSQERKITAKLEQLEKDNKMLEDQARGLRHACHVARQWLQQHRACLDSCATSTSVHSPSGLSSGSSGCSASSGSSRHCSGPPVVSPGKHVISALSPGAHVISPSPLLPNTSASFRQHSELSFGGCRHRSTSSTGSSRLGSVSSSSSRLNSDSSGVTSP